jgi:hypothetical protein
MLIDDEEYRSELLFPELEGLRLVLGPPESVPSESNVVVSEGAARFLCEWHTEIVEGSAVHVFDHWSSDLPAATNNG